MASAEEILILATRHHRAGQLAEAERLYRQILAVEPHNAATLHQMGMLALQARKFADAVDWITHAIRADRSQPAFYMNLSEAYRHLGQLAEAAQSLRTATQIQPNAFDAHTRLAGLLRAQHDLEEAAVALRAALRLKPDDVDARTELGCVLLDQNKLSESEACFRRVLLSCPERPEAHFNLGTSLQAQARLDQAIAAYQQTLELDPGYAMAYVNIGTAYNDQGMSDEAIDYYRKALELKPDFSFTYGNIAVALQTSGRQVEAGHYHRQAIELAPDNPGLWSNYLYFLNFQPEHDAETIVTEHRRWGRLQADPLTAHAPPHSNDRNPQRRLRIGYVSPHFKSHAVNFFVEPILASHDHLQFEVFCYSGVAREDSTTQTLRTYADHWRSIVGVATPDVVEMIRNDLIDILVDLTGHIGENRILVFASKPAPIQVTYLGYQNTTGMCAMDYRLTDEYADPPGTTEALHTERLARLPRTFFCYQPSHDAPLVSPLPAPHNGFVTFGSFNNFRKITPQVLHTWAEILARATGSRLIVLADMSASVRQYLIDTFAQRGIEASRLELVHRLSRAKYLALIDRADIALDPFPFNGHTTTCDALWQGVPVVTLSGHTYVSRFGGSGLATLGLEELIAHSRDEYIDVAVALSADRPRLEKLRATLRPRMAESPLLDFAGFTRKLEAEYRWMWIEWCGQPPG